MNVNRKFKLLSMLLCASPLMFAISASAEDGPGSATSEKKGVACQTESSTQDNEGSQRAEMHDAEGQIQHSMAEIEEQQIPGRQDLETPVDERKAVATEFLHQFSIILPKEIKFWGEDDTPETRKPIMRKTAELGPAMSSPRFERLIKAKIKQIEDYLSVDPGELAKDLGVYRKGLQRFTIGFNDDNITVQDIEYALDLLDEYSRVYSDEDRQLFFADNPKESDFDDLRKKVDKFQYKHIGLFYMFLTPGLSRDDWKKVMSTNRNCNAVIGDFCPHILIAARALTIKEIVADQQEIIKKSLQMENLNNQLKGLKDKLYESKQENTNKEKEIARLGGLIKNNEADIESLKKSLTKSEKELTGLRSTYRESQHENDSLKRDLEECKKSDHWQLDSKGGAEGTQSLIDKLQREKKVSDMKIANLEQQVKESQKKEKALTKELNKFRVTYDLHPNHAAPSTVPLSFQQSCSLIPASSSDNCLTNVQEYDFCIQNNLPFPVAWLAHHFRRLGLEKSPGFDQAVSQCNNITGYETDGTTFKGIPVYHKTFICGASKKGLSLFVAPTVLFNGKKLDGMFPSMVSFLALGTHKTNTTYDLQCDFSSDGKSAISPVICLQEDIGK